MSPGGTGSQASPTHHQSINVPRGEDHEQVRTQSPITTQTMAAVDRRPTMPSATSRAFGLHSMLNPSDTSVSLPPISTTPRQSPYPHQNPGRYSRQISPVRHSAQLSHPQASPNVSAHGQASSAHPGGPKSPDVAHRSTSSMYPRHILSPKSPRHASLGSRMLEARPSLPQMQHSNSAPTWNLGKNSDMAGPRSQQPVPVPPLRHHHEPTHSVSGPQQEGHLPMQRTSSQPFMPSMPGPPSGQSPHLQGHASQDSRSRLPAHPPGGGPGRDPRQTTQGPIGEGTLSSAFMSALQSGRAESRSMASEPLALMMQGGEAVPVALDFQQGSRQADEKRQRNAGASSRFRARKKEKERANQSQLQRLESDNQKLSSTVRNLERDRDFYRTERDRLRDIVRRTPGIRELAEQSPPSPTSTRSGGSIGGASEMFSGSYIAESSPTSGAAHGSAHPSPMTNDHSAERPARRRRTDSAPEFPSGGANMAPRQASGTPGRAPPMLPHLSAGPYSGGPPPPPPPHGSTRLPPIRLDHPAMSPEGSVHQGSTVQTPPQYSAGQVQGLYFSHGPRSTSGSAGWATSFRGPETQP